jgi:phosphomannomutase
VVEVYLFSELRPTLVWLLAVKHLGCQCGIVLTASHNPRIQRIQSILEDGGQIVPPEDEAIINTIEKLNSIKLSLKQ